MASYRPALDNVIPLMLFVPTWSKVQGVEKKTFPKTGVLFYGGFKSYGGTERDVNGLYSIEDTAEVVCWYRPDIKSDCRIEVCDTGAKYEIINEPENVNMRNQFLKFKVKRIKGGA